MNNGKKVQADYEMITKWFKTIGEMKTPERLTYDDKDGYHVFNLGKGVSGQELKATEFKAYRDSFAIDYGGDVDIFYSMDRAGNPVIKFELLEPGGPSSFLVLTRDGRYSMEDYFNEYMSNELTQLVKDDNYSIKEILEKLSTNAEYKDQDLAEVWLSLYTDIESLAKQRLQPTQQAGIINSTNALENALRDGGITATDVQTAIESKTSEQSIKEGKTNDDK